MAKKILIVDDDKDLVESLAQVLQTPGLRNVAAAFSGGRRACGRSSPSGPTWSYWTS